MDLYLYSAFLVFRPLKALLHYVSHSPFHTAMAKSIKQKLTHSCTFTHWCYASGAIWGSVSCSRILRHVPGGAGDRTNNLPIGGWPALPLSHSRPQWEHTSNCKAIYVFSCSECRLHCSFNPPMRCGCVFSCKVHPALTLEQFSGVVSLLVGCEQGKCS